MVDIDSGDVVVRDYSRAAKIFVAIRLRELEEGQKEDSDGPDTGLRPGFD